MKSLAYSGLLASTNGLSFIDVISILGAIGSIVLAVLAIWLSVKFYAMSQASSQDIHTAAKDIGASVERLENLFEHLYSDMFGMMRDTVGDMRRHMWGNEEDEQEEDAPAEVQELTDVKLDQLKADFETQITEAVSASGLVDARLKEFRDEVTPLIETLVARSREVDTEVREDAIQEAIVQRLRAWPRSKPLPANRVTEWMAETGYSVQEVLAVLRRMRDYQLIDYEGLLRPHTEIRRIPVRQQGSTPRPSSDGRTAPRETAGAPPVTQHP